jgi:hypothetical protein
MRTGAGRGGADLSQDAGKGGGAVEVAVGLGREAGHL